MQIHRWAEALQISIALATTAHQLAGMAGPAFKMAKAMRERRLDGVLPPRPSAQTWLALYRKHRQSWKILADLAGSPQGSGPYTRKVAGASRFWVNLAKNDPKAFEAEIEKIPARKLLRCETQPW
jgi:hypothetical protein